MKFSIKREELISILSEYTNILKDNPIKPIVSGLQIKAENNNSTNISIFYSMKVNYNFQLNKYYYKIIL